MSKITMLSVLSLLALAACAESTSGTTRCADEDKAALGINPSVQIQPDYMRRNLQARLASEMDDVLARRKADCHAGR